MSYRVTTEAKQEKDLKYPAFSPYRLPNTKNSPPPPPLVIPTLMSGRSHGGGDGHEVTVPQWGGGGGLHYTMVALKLQQFR